MVMAITRERDLLKVELFFLKFTLGGVLKGSIPPVPGEMQYYIYLNLRNEIWCFGSMTRPPHAASSVVGYASDTASAVAKVEPNSNRSHETGRPYYDSQRSTLASRWQSEMVPSHVYYVTENVENFQSKCYHFTATKTSETVSVKQYEHDRVTRCTFSVDFKEIKTISQSLPSTYAICLKPRQSGRHRGV